MLRQLVLTLHTGLAPRPFQEWDSQHLETNCERRKGEPALSDKNNVSKYCSFHTHKKKLEHLEKQSTHPANFSLFLNKYFKILINNSDCKQNSSARANGPKEVGQHRQGADA